VQRVFQRFFARPARVLVVDPDTEGTQAVAQILQPVFRVDVVATGQQALQRLSTFQPDLVMTEFDLPDMVGIDLIRASKEYTQSRQITWIIATTRRAIADKVASFQVGADDFLVKPLQLQDLPYLLLARYRFHQVTHRLSFP
jgi:DNA-binding response OmpR family regulator